MNNMSIQLQTLSDILCLHESVNIYGKLARFTSFILPPKFTTSFFKFGSSSATLIIFKNDNDASEKGIKEIIFISNTFRFSQWPRV